MESRARPARSSGTSVARVLASRRAAAAKNGARAGATGVGAAATGAAAARSASSAGTKPRLAIRRSTQSRRRRARPACAIGEVRAGAAIIPASVAAWASESPSGSLPKYARAAAPTPINPTPSWLPR